MATKQQIEKFINDIGECAQKAYKEIGKVKPSVCIGMACVESAYGTAGSTRYNSYLGHKVGSGKTALKYWNGTGVNLKTKEEYSGKLVGITDAFRTYTSMEQCVFNFYELLNTKLYAKVKADESYVDQMKHIKECDYMTSSKEVNTVLQIIEKYDLTKFDSSVEPVECPFERPKMLLIQGQKNVHVKWLQWMLNHANMGYNIDVDGIFGNITAGTVLDFQRKKGIVLVDENICEALEKSCT